MVECQGLSHGKSGGKYGELQYFAQINPANLKVAEPLDKSTR